MSRPIGMAHPVDMGDGVTLNQFRPYIDSDHTDYWIDIQGYRIPLTKKQFIVLHEARIQLWDKATEQANKLTIKTLEHYAQKELERLRNPHTKVMSEEHLAYYEGLLEAVFVLKGEKK